jgi:hypothetical protein
MAKESFDAGYYGKYYGSARTRVHGPKEIARLCCAVTSMIEWWGAPLDSVIDVGAGVGLWRDWFAKHRPKTAYRTTEVSRYACAQYGHEQRDITRYIANLLIFLGLLGTFYGLATTVPAMVEGSSWSRTLRTV